MAWPSPAVAPQRSLPDGVDDRPHSGCAGEGDILMRQGTVQNSNLFSWHEAEQWFDLAPVRHEIAFAAGIAQGGDTVVDAQTVAVGLDGCARAGRPAQAVQRAPVIGQRLAVDIEF